MKGIGGYIWQMKEGEKPEVREEGNATKKCLYQKISYNNIFIEWNVTDKFEKDKCCKKTEKYVCVLDGVILNKNKLFSQYGCQEIFALIVTMYKKNGEQFFKEFRGMFSGFFHDREKDIILIFTNHSGEKTLFYSIDNKGTLFWGSKVQIVQRFLDQNSVTYNLDIAAAYSMLSYAYMYDSLTLIEQVKRLRAGEYIRVFSGNWEVKSYYKVKNEVVNRLSEEEAIEEIERLFSDAVSMQLKKNEEYGYFDYIPLSAGLDSRMTTYCAAKLKGKPSYNFTYSETGQLDFKIPMKIANELKNHWGFKNLDNGLALYDIEESARIADGLIYYVWPAQLRDIFKYLNLEKMGLIHTGVIGDVIIGTFFKGAGNEPYRIGDGAYSKRLTPKLKEIVKEADYPNYEIGMYYNRAFNGACLGYTLTFQEYTEAFSPFMDVEVMNFCLSLPLEYRKHHRIYYKWVGKYYPEVLKYEHNGIKIPTYRYPDIVIKGKRINLERIPSLIKTMVKEKTALRSGMNPFEYWYRNNLELKNILDDYLSENIERLDGYGELKSDTEFLYKQGNTLEKLQAISLVAAVKMLFDKNSR